MCMHRHSQALLEQAISLELCLAHNSMVEFPCYDVVTAVSDAGFGLF